MPSPFQSYDYTKALTLFFEREDEGVEKSYAYYKGDHYQNGQGSTLPSADGSDQVSQTIKSGIKRNFISKNVTRSVVKRHRRGVIGREPGWIISLRRPLRMIKNEQGEMVEEAPSNEEQTLINEANQRLLDWWNFHRALLEFRKSVTHFLVGGRGPLRFYIPPDVFKAAADGRSVVPRMKAEEAIKVIFLLSVEPKEAAVAIDPVTRRKASAFLYKNAEGQQIVELSYLDDDGQTVFRILTADGQSFVARAVDQARQFVGRMFGTRVAENAWKFPMGGKLFVFQMEADPLITEQVRENQALVAKALTTLSINMDESAYRERIYLNAQPPGRQVMIDDPDNPGKKVKAFVSGVMPTGPGSRGFVQGVSWTDTGGPDGKKTTHLATPSVHDSEPVDVKSFDDAASIGTRNVLEECDQLHVEIAKDATATGESRKQARDEYQSSLDETKTEVDYVGSEACEAVLAMIAILTGQPGRYDSLRVTFTTRLNPGPLSADDRRLIIEEKKEKLRSTENAMEQIGIEDPDAMKAKIKEEEAEAPPQPPPNQPLTNQPPQPGQQGGEGQ